jgi:ABC-type sugar transport system permease subunit
VFGRFPQNIPKYILNVVVLTIWIFIALVIGIPHLVHMNQQMYGNVGYCTFYIFLLSTNPFLTMLIFSFAKGAG